MDHADLLSVIECAGLAPSVHNTQPWSFVVKGDVIEARADRRRALPVLDPHGRQLTVSCGAAIEFAHVAVRALGWDCIIDVLPDPSDPDLLARLQLGDRRAASVRDTDLVEAITRRFTDRGGYAVAEISHPVAADLKRGVAHRGSWLKILTERDDRVAVIQALTDAEDAESIDPAYRAELADWLRHEHSSDGLPASALGSGANPESVNEVPVRDFTGNNSHPHPGGDGPPPPVERDNLLVIGTEGDDPTDWINAGRAAGWLLLRLTVEGLSSQPLGQALDVEAFRQILSRRLGFIGHVQFLSRAGTGHGMPATGRRRATVTA